MLDRELEIKALFKSAGCYCEHDRNSPHHPKAQEVFRTFLNDWLASSSMITGTKLIAATREVDLVVRHSLKSLTPSQKLDTIISVYDNLTIDPLNANRLKLGHLTKNAIGFINKSVVPVKRCLITHFGNDKKRFLKASNDAVQSFPYKMYC